MSYKPGDKIFAKVKGHPHWPSRINLLPNDVSVPKGKFPIFFYGTHEVYFLAPKDIYPYEKFKQKYGIKRNKLVFMEGLKEIEENPNVLLYGKDPAAEAFLAQFYSFKRGGDISLHELASSATSAQKRPNVVSSEEQHQKPAKRLHTESEKTPNKKSPGSSKQIKSRNSLRTNTHKSMDQALVQTVNSKDLSLGSNKRVQSGSPHVSVLRLRIRKNSSGQITSTRSSPASPSTPGSNATLEACHAEPDELPSQPSSDGLKITIRSNSTNLLPTCDKSKYRPVVSVTPTPSSLTSTCLSSVEPGPQRSTAVVTPLLRNVLPEISDDSSDETDDSMKNIKLSTTEQKQNKCIYESTHATNRSASLRMKKKHSKSKREVTFSDGSGSEEETQTVRTWNSNEWSKSTENSRKSTASILSIPKSSNMSPSVNSHRVSNVPCAFVGDNVRDKQQQLKDLDAEERLLLIDRAIKSSLVQGHEDISTCIEKLVILDRMNISLPVMAKCWIIVETIRKCRRYKRSLEVQIAAKRVFNKFLQLYVTADKTELDLAHAELIKHQQRYAKKHSLKNSKAEGLETQSSIDCVSSYNGPKSMADLFQVSVAPQCNNKRQSKFDHNHNVDTLQSPNSVDIPAFTNHASTVSSIQISEDKPAISLPNELAKTQSIVNSTVCFSKETDFISSEQHSVCIQDIPLPEESSARLDHSVDSLFIDSDLSKKKSDSSELISDILGEEEFELLDEYENSEEPDYNLVNEINNENSLVSQTTLPVINFSVPVSSGCQYAPIPPYLNASRIPNQTSHLTTTSGSYTLVHPTVDQSNFSILSSGSEIPSQTTPKHLSPQQPSYHTSIEGTPPQSASRAYVPHSLHPSEDPPPPYRPYIPSRCDLEQIDDSPKHAVSVNNSHSSRAHYSKSSGVSSNRINTPRVTQICTKTESSRKSCLAPHRARSPHALPHPLEHYQRCLNSALSSDEEKPYICCSKKVSQNNKQTDEKNQFIEIKIDSMKPINKVDTPDSVSQTQDNPPAEDLDTRIARLQKMAMRATTTSVFSASECASTERSKPSPNQLSQSLVSPPPPPPPLPTSQRIFFTHRPQHSNQVQSPTSLESSVNENNLQNSTIHSQLISDISGSFDNNQRKSAVATPELVLLGSVSRHHFPPVAPCDANHLISSDLAIQPSRLTNYSNSAPTGIADPVYSYARGPYFRNPLPNQLSADHHAHFQRREYVRPPLPPRQPGNSRAHSRIDQNDHGYRSRHRSGRDEERDLYSMLGV